MVEYRKATAEDLEAIWDYQIETNPGDPNWIRWKKQFIDDNNSGAAATFVAVVGGIPVGEGTLLFSPDCRAIRGRLELADGKTVTNINALRIREAYEGKGYISQLVKYMEAGVREYWILDPYQQKLIVYFFESDAYPVIYGLDQPVPIGIYNGELVIQFEHIKKWVEAE